jgi:hypothetical protein
VIYKGFDNIDGFQKYLGMKSPNLLVLVFVFGLIHGFGLSTRLQQLPLDGDGLLLKILSFNVGVEVGQIVALTLMLFILAGWRKRESFARLSAAANVLLMVAGALLMLMQLHGLTHDLHADELAFNRDAHQQEHAANRPPTAAVRPTAHRTAPITVSVPPGKGVEYKFFLARSASMSYVWKSSGPPLFFDFHGEPAGDKTGYFKSFRKNTSAQDRGTVAAPFTGTVGWYWKNKTETPATVTIWAEGQHLVMNTSNQARINQLTTAAIRQRAAAAEAPAAPAALE